MEKEQQLLFPSLSALCAVHARRPPSPAGLPVLLLIKRIKKVLEYCNCHGSNANTLFKERIIDIEDKNTVSRFHGNNTMTILKNLLLDTFGLKNPFGNPARPLSVSGCPLPLSLAEQIASRQREAELGRRRRRRQAELWGKQRAFVVTSLEFRSLRIYVTVCPYLQK